MKNEDKLKNDKTIKTYVIDTQRDKNDQNINEHLLENDKNKMSITSDKFYPADNRNISFKGRNFYKKNENKK